MTLLTNAIETNLKNIFKKDISIEDKYNEVLKYMTEFAEQSESLTKRTNATVNAYANRIGVLDSQAAHYEKLFNAEVKARIGLDYSLTQSEANREVLSNTIEELNDKLLRSQAERHELIEGYENQITNLNLALEQAVAEKAESNKAETKPKKQQSAQPEVFEFRSEKDSNSDGTELTEVEANS